MSPSPLGHSGSFAHRVLYCIGQELVSRRPGSICSVGTPLEVNRPGDSPPRGSETSVGPLHSHPHPHSCGAARPPPPRLFLGGPSHPGEPPSHWTQVPSLHGPVPWLPVCAGCQGSIFSLSLSTHCERTSGPWPKGRRIGCRLHLGASSPPPPPPVPPCLPSISLNSDL